MRKGPFVLAGALALLLMYFAAVPWLHYIRKSRRAHSPESWPLYTTRLREKRITS